MSLSSTAQIYIDGDSRSLTGGGVTAYPDVLKTSWSYILSPVTAGNFTNNAQGGALTDNVINRFADGVYPVNTNAPAYFFCWVGINDLLQSVREPIEIYDNLKVIWKFARQRYFKVVAFATGIVADPLIALQVRALDNLVTSDFSLYDVLIRPDEIMPVVPANDGTHLWYIDGVHPNSAGHQRIASHIMTVLGS